MKKEQDELSKAYVTNQLLSLGVKKGDVLLVHTSFRATRPVEGGPEGLIMAILDAIGHEGTLVMPSWTENDNEVFDPLNTPVSPDLGVVAEIFWRLPGVVRSNHCFAFAALGPKATYIVSDSLPIPPHIPESPIGRVYELDERYCLLELIMMLIQRFI